MTDFTLRSFHGRLRSITGVNPAVQTEISEAVDARRRWILRAVHFTLVADAGGAARAVSFIIDDGADHLYHYTFTNTVAATMTRTFHLSFSGAAESIKGEDIFASLPPLPLGPAYRIRTETTNFAAGDDYGAPQLLVEEWLDP